MQNAFREHCEWTTKQPSPHSLTSIAVAVCKSVTRSVKWDAYGINKNNFSISTYTGGVTWIPTPISFDGGSIAMANDETTSNNKAPSGTADAAEGASEKAQAISTEQLQALGGIFTQQQRASKARLAQQQQALFTALMQQQQATQDIFKQFMSWGGGRASAPEKPTASHGEETAPNF